MFRYAQDNTNIKSKKQFLSQIQESFMQLGTDVLYIKRIESDESLTGGDYENMLYAMGIQIIMKYTGNEEFGTTNFYGKYNYSAGEETSSLYATIHYLDGLGIKPEIGDIIFIESMNKKIIEVVDVTYETKNNKYPFGSGSMVYEIKCKPHHIDLITTYATGNDDIDTQNDQDVKTNARYDKEVKQKNVLYDIVDDTEKNPINDFE